MTHLSADDALRLYESRPDISAFGPDSAHPWLAIDLAGCRTDLMEWLSSRPCPIIGLGKGKAKLIQACDVHLKDMSALPRIARNIEQNPFAAMVLVQHLRASETLEMREALTAESFAYATLQMGPEFARWKDGAASQPPLPTLDRSLVVNVDETIEIILNAPETRNAIDVRMRDALCETLDLALALDCAVRLTGRGRTFSVGGAIEEFGEVSDPTMAHWIRTLRLPANRLAQLSPKLRVHVNGAAIGAGVEMAAFGANVTASSESWFQLPELKYGLIPGAGGTVSLPRRIGRQRTAYLALSMDRLRADDALAWGLVDEII